jgi:hypothetical protein
VIGYLFVIKTDDFSNFFGVIPSAERYLGGGGTRLAYKLIGVGLCLLGVVVITGWYEEIVGGFIISVFG